MSTDSDSSRGCLDFSIPTLPTFPRVAQLDPNDRCLINEGDFKAGQGPCQG